ncbi:MAG TPA: extracellular solute-binding protein, partial [Chloroflexota bacterium]|nr:extracellular solute-binding protein [Chloroflexota bacterium]
MATRLSRRRLLGTAAVFAVLGPLIAACGQAAAPAATVAPAKPAEPTRPTAAEPTSAPAATKPAEAAKPAAPAAAAPAKAVGGKGVKIQYMHVFAPEGPAGETLKRLFERFNSSQGDVVAESVFVAGGQLGEKTNALLAAGTPPDILWGGFTVKWADEGLIVPVEDLFSLTNFDVKRFPGTFPDLLRYKRKLWVLPYELSAVTVGYNADLFKEKGVPEPKFGWTWEQMTEAALKLTDPAKNIWGWNNTRPAWQWF